MQLTFEQMALASTEDELSPEQTRNIPFFGFVTGTAISVVLWGAIAWMVWAVIT